MNEMNDKIKELREQERQIEIRTADKINAILTELTDKKIYINTGIRPEYTFSKEEWYLEFSTDINFLKEDGTRYFHGEFHVTWDKDSLNINCGTSGNYDKTAIEQVSRVKMIANIWNNIEAIESQIRKVLDEVKEEYLTAWNKRVEEETKLRKEETAKKEQKKTEILNSLTVDSKYIDDKEQIYTITKITPQRVYFNVNKNGYGYNDMVKKEAFALKVFMENLKPITV